MQKRTEGKNKPQKVFFLKKNNRDLCTTLLIFFFYWKEGFFPHTIYSNYCSFPSTPPSSFGFNSQGSPRQVQAEYQVRSYFMS